VAEDKQRPSLKLYAADISDRKKMEDDLRRNEYELKSVVENTPDIYFRMNRQQQYVFVNPTYERLTGLMKEQFIGKTNSQLGMTPQMIRFWQSAVQEAFESGREHTAEFEMSGFFGKRYFSARVIPEFEKTGLVETVLVVARDITDKKHVEEEIASIKK
jgi:PAS domain S-box-containing protein